MDSERFSVGQQFQYGGIDFRIRAGMKVLGDLVLEWHAPTGWQPVPMDALFLAVDFLCWNEDRLYPYDSRDPHPKLGGQYLIRALTEARVHGFRRAVVRLAAQRAEQARRREEGA